MFKTKGDKDTGSEMQCVILKGPFCYADTAKQLEKPKQGLRFRWSDVSMLIS